MNLFGMKDSLIGPIELLFGGAAFLSAAIFRRLVANDMLGMDFSAYGATITGIIGWLTLNFIFHNLKISLIAGIIGILAGGFLFARFFPDGQSSGDSDGDFEGNYEE